MASATSSASTRRRAGPIVGELTMLPLKPAFQTAPAGSQARDSLRARPLWAMIARPLPARGDRRPHPPARGEPCERQAGYGWWKRAQNRTTSQEEGPCCNG